MDEFHMVYPDQVGVRKMELHYSRPERKHDWVEQIVAAMGGLELSRLIHRIGAVFLGITSVFHLIYIVGMKKGRRYESRV